jgi:hypothetical protein
MKLVYSPSANQRKKEIIGKYPGIAKFFDVLEQEIIDDPLRALEEKLLLGGRWYTTYKRYIKTVFFSGMLPDTYLFLSLNYAITTDDRIAILNVSVHDYAN